MKPQRKIYAVRQAAPGIATLCCALAISRAAQAQEQVLAPPPVYSVTPPAMEEYEASQPGAPVMESLASGIGEQQQWQQWGPVTLHPHVLYQFLYGWGIQSAPGQPQNTVNQQFSPGLLLAIGRHWTLDYTPTFSFYSSSSFQNSVNQNVILTWGTTYQDWAFGFSQGYVKSSNPLAQTAMQTDTDSYVTTASASYHFSRRMSVDFSISQNFESAQGFTSTHSWSTMNWINYELGDRWDTGIGGGYEYDDVSPGPNMMSEQLQGRFRMRVTRKVSLVLHGGLQDQQYFDGGAGSLLTPVFGISAQYTPVETTSISLSADRSLTPSLFSGQVIQATSVSANLSQRLLTRLNLGAGASYGRTTYLATTNTPTAGTGRLDNYYSFNVRLSTVFLQRGTAAVFYQYSANPSTQPGFSFNSSQVGFTLGYRY